MKQLKFRVAWSSSGHRSRCEAGRISRRGSKFSGIFTRGLCCSFRVPGVRLLPFRIARGMLLIAHRFQLIEQRLEAFFIDLAGDGFLGFFDYPGADARVVFGGRQDHPAQNDFLAGFELAALGAQTGEAGLDDNGQDVSELVQALLEKWVAKQQKNGMTA
jgi:hypothetical protein